MFPRSRRWRSQCPTPSHSNPTDRSRWPRNGLRISGRRWRNSNGQRRHYPTPRWCCRHQHAGPREERDSGRKTRQLGEGGVIYRDFGGALVGDIDIAAERDADADARGPGDASGNDSGKHQATIVACDVVGKLIRDIEIADWIHRQRIGIVEMRGHRYGGGGARVGGSRGGRSGVRL